MKIKDQRDYQIIFLTSFLWLGLGTRDWTIQPLLIATIILTCLFTQWLLRATVEISKKQNYSYDFNLGKALGTCFEPQVINSLKSSLITSLGLCLLLRSNSDRTMIIAAFCAIASKFLFRYGKKHFFNPANFGIICALVLTNDAWVSPGQWGTDWWYLLLFAGMGGVVLRKVGRWDTSVTFLLSFSALEALRNYWLGWDWGVLFHQLSSGSLLLFALFMLTDPRSIPNATIGRILWSIAIAIVTFILQDYFYLTTAIFWALFIVSPFTVVFDKLWNAPRFVWNKELLSRSL